MPTMQKSTLHRVLYAGIVLLVFSSLIYPYFFQKHNNVTLYINAAGDYTKLMLLKSEDANNDDNNKTGIAVVYPAHSEKLPAANDGKHHVSNESITRSIPMMPQHEDACGLDRNNARTATWSSYSQSERDVFKVVRTCAKQFGEAKIVGEFRYLEKLQCNLDVTQNISKSTMLEHERIWFIGDSLLVQQFYLLLCTLNPNVEIQDLETYHRSSGGSPSEPIEAEYTYHHSKGSTKLLYTRFGYNFDKAEHSLYVGAFPKAVASLTDRDAIVVNGSSHYDSRRATLMERALNHIGRSSLSANASVYYMEPALEEWPTSNGIYQPGCYGVCKCQEVDAERVAGRGNYSAKVHNRYFYKLPVPSTDFFGKLYSDLSFTENTTNCIPDCLPATWRVDLSRSILLNNNYKVEMVPNWWQSYDKSGSLSHLEGQNDCTHKSSEAVMMMNQQLVRSMVKRHARG